MKPVLVLVSCKDKKEAAAISKALLTQRLAACAKQLSVGSSFWWEGKVEEAKEILLVLETLSKHFGGIEEEVTKLHSYTQPVITQIPIEKVSFGTKDWIREATDSL